MRQSASRCCGRWLAQVALRLRRALPGGRITGRRGRAGGARVQEASTWSSDIAVVRRGSYTACEGQLWVGRASRGGAQGAHRPPRSHWLALARQRANGKQEGQGVTLLLIDHCGR